MSAKCTPLTLGFVFDDVIHRPARNPYDSLGEPRPGANRAIRKLLDAGAKVVVVSHRVHQHVKFWLYENNFPDLHVTTMLPWGARAITRLDLPFDGGWDEPSLYRLIPTPEDLAQALQRSDKTSSKLKGAGSSSVARTKRKGSAGASSGA